MKNIIKTVFIMSLSTILSLLFKKMDISEANIVTTFILGVLVVASKTEGYAYGIISSVLGVLLFNFFFTEPYYTLLAYRADYPITFIIMLVAAITTSTMTVNVKTEFEKSLVRENRIKMLYMISKGLMRAKNVDEIVEIAGSHLSDILKQDVIIALSREDGTLQSSKIFLNDPELNLNIFSSSREKSAMFDCFKNKRDTGKGTEYFQENIARYIPLLGKDHSIGVIGVTILNEDFVTEGLKTLVQAVANQISISIEKEVLTEERQRINLEIEKERLRGNLLRSISHDLRTPLTGISGTVATLIENKNAIDELTQYELLKNIQEDTRWLIHTFENILNITKLDEGKLSLNINIEVAEEIIAESIAIKRKNLENRILKVNLPEEPLIFEVDGSLIRQVIINLLDNAIRYTPDYSTISLSVYRLDSNVIFEISDDGPGIPPENLPHIFERFFQATQSSEESIERRGVGLGLTICKSIVEAHGGLIEAFNNEIKGATFRFTLPNGGICDEK